MNLTKKQLRMLNVIKAQTRCGMQVSASTVAGELFVTKSSAQRMLWHLADLGMLTRPTMTVVGEWRVTGDGDDELSSSGAD